MHVKPPHEPADKKLWQYINLKLAALGCPTAKAAEDAEFQELVHVLLAHQRETERLLANYLCPADWRIQAFLDDYLYETGLAPKLPNRTLVLDRPGLARTLSLPPDRDTFKSAIVSSYRLHQGVLHNPKSDRRTTQGIFHIAEGGLPVPDDKIAVPKRTYAEVLQCALRPPPDLMRLPFTSSQTEEARCWVSLLLRPVVCPEVPGFTPEKSMEIRFFVPGNLVCNLDFVENIFGNAGDPVLPENDAGLDTGHWTGHSGCVILAPHLVGMTKRDVGLPHWDHATERQRHDGMCWKSGDELYNNGSAFKLTARDERGVMVTIIADNYFGYCKKEVKTQISFSANLFGLAEEEHAGGALVFPSYDLGEDLSGRKHMPRLDYSWEEVAARYGSMMHLHPEGYGVDKLWPEVIYVPEDVQFDLREKCASWTNASGTHRLPLRPEQIYLRPSGYKIRMERVPGSNKWRLVGTVAEGVFCHKPCTVSGGGKSEISKAITDAIIQGPVFVADFRKDFDFVADLIRRDYRNRFKDAAKNNKDSRPILSDQRSLGSVIKLLTPASREYSAEYNAWLRSIPQHIRELVFVVKRFYKPEWGDDWRSRFSVDIINGVPGNELKFETRKLVTSYVRVGYEQDGSWRTFGLRKDFHAAMKIQMEDDITASVVVPAEKVAGLNPLYANPSVKFALNCETRLFQRPDDAIHRGYDKQTEADFAMPGNFFSNYEPLGIDAVRALVEDVVDFGHYTGPMQEMLREFAGRPWCSFIVAPSHPRIVDGRPTKNPRYLQLRPDLARPLEAYVAETSMRLQRRIAPGAPVPKPVNVVVPGRRNNPPESGIRSLAVFNPIHFLELPELFMEFICSMTGKSPSTTGAGSEGALTKGPFNALPPIYDLNNALVSFLLTDAQAFITAAGFVGPHVRVDHDISLLVPEILARMTVEERDPKFLMRNGYLEKCRDFEHGGKKVLASRLGHRITARFARTYFGRMFNHPDRVFTDEMLRPELQDMEVFADGVANIVETQKRVAMHYFNDQSIETACPPLKALLQIMAHDHFEGRGLGDPKIRTLFTRDNMMASDWYAARLRMKQTIDTRLWRQNVAYLTKFITLPYHTEEAARLKVEDRLHHARLELKRVSTPEYLNEIRGTLGAQPLGTRSPA